MNQQIIQHIIKRHYRKIKKQLNKIAADFGTEAIHQFRISYKKLRAFLRMISQQNETAGKLKISKKIKTCYHLSGLLRDFQIHQQHIKKATKQELKKPAEYLNLLRVEMDKVTLQLSEIIKTHPVATSEKKTAKHIPDKFSIKNLNLYSKEKWNEVSKIIVGSSYSEQTLHSIRKILKDLFYNLKKNKTTENKGLSKYIRAKINENNFKKLLDELGNFQDKSAGLALLKPSGLMKLNKYNQQLLNQIKKEWTKDKAAMKHLLVTKLQTDFKTQTT